MAQTIFEQNGGTYTQQGDYLLPNIKIPDQPELEIGVWGNRRRQYLKKHHRVKYYNMLTQLMFDRLVNQLSEKENVTEKLKAKNPMLWVQRTNNIRNRVMEIVNTELIYA